MPAPPATAPLSWSLVVPVKVLARAKTRLASLAGPDRPALALAMAADTVAAALDCPQVGRVIVVTDDPQAAEVLAGLGALIVPDRPGRGLNGALRHGAAHAGSRWPRSGIGGLAADLPALRPAELGDALRAAARWPQAFVPDSAGSGTTLYAVRPGTAFRPRFGPGRPPATGRPGRPKSPGPAWPASAATSMSRRTCAGRGNWGSGPAPRRSPRG